MTCERTQGSTKPGKLSELTSRGQLKKRCVAQLAPEADTVRQGRLSAVAETGSFQLKAGANDNYSGVGIYTELVKTGKR